MIPLPDRFLSDEHSNSKNVLLPRYFFLNLCETIAYSYYLLNVANIKEQNELQFLI